MRKKFSSNPILWSSSDQRVKFSQLFTFMQSINEKYHLNLNIFSELHNWSIENKSNFFLSNWDFFEIIDSKRTEPYIKPANKMPESIFFPTGSTNYAENILREIFLVLQFFKSEDKIRREVFWKDLKSQVANLANYLKKEGIVKGDRVVAYTPNMPEKVIMMLATSSIGAIFLSASPDFGANGVLGRFGHIEPKILLTTDGYWYNGKKINITNKVSAVVKSLTSLKRVIFLPLLRIKKEYDDKFINITLSKKNIPHIFIVTINIKKLTAQPSS